MDSNISTSVSPSIEQLRMTSPYTSYDASLLFGVQDEEMSSLLDTNITRFSPCFAWRVKLIVAQPWDQLVVLTRSLWGTWNMTTQGIRCLLMSCRVYGDLWTVTSWALTLWSISNSRVFSPFVRSIQTVSEKYKIYKWFYLTCDFSSSGYNM